MNDITININGGNNQILPNATEAVQNFYGDQFAEKILGNPSIRWRIKSRNRQALPIYK